MSQVDAMAWTTANQRYLSAAVQAVREMIERIAESTTPAPADAPSTAGRWPDGLAPAMPAPAALEALCAVFGLSSFERSVLVMCAGFELQASFATCCGRAPAGVVASGPTFGLALAAFPDAHWSALAPHAPLRRWRLVELGPGASLATSPLRIDEAVLHYLAGCGYYDHRLAEMVAPLPDTGEPLTASHRRLVDSIVRQWAQSDATLPVVQLCGGANAGTRRVAAAAAAAADLTGFVLPAPAIPTAPHELNTLLRSWDRQAALSRSALLVETDGAPAAGPDAAALGWLLERIGGVVMLAARERVRVPHRPSCVLDVRKPTADEQRRLWRRALAVEDAELNGSVDLLVSHFDLGAADIAAAARRARAEAAGTAELGALLWGICREQARPRLDDLAVRVDPVATWGTLVLPEAQVQVLRDVAAQVRHRSQVYERWGFASLSARGLGITALFAGASGTGKTLAAEVLANDLHLDLYVIDLSRLVSKYIGETEKNLSRVFDAAEEGGAVLLFDEADALFGKRGEVKDSHDRYANIEISYLLQRMETYRGLAILTTNMKDAIDAAFLRRIRFLVSFPFPGVEERAEIWRRSFPADTPTESLDIGKLACLNVAGGNIRNIAVNAAFLAAGSRSPVCMRHLLAATRKEYRKLEKPLTDAEIRGWV